MLTLVVQILLVVGLMFVGRALFEIRGALELQRSETLDRIEELARQSEAVAVEHRALHEEIMRLRGYVTSRTSEDVLFLKIMVAKPRLEVEVAREIARHVKTYATLYEQDPDLVLAMIDVESDFNPQIVSYMGATGLMQVMPQWRKVLAIQEELTDIETSIKYGLQILGFYREMYKDLEVALTAYNRGPGAVDAALMRGSDPKNQYAPRVLERYAYFRALNGNLSREG
ncbi:MAG: lytic transglycosylase domain-containing protein [Myxococcales bacterium]|nr:lytic transglycosylase domain-containing protein [Myxococcales bacterium]